VEWCSPRTSGADDIDGDLPAYLEQFSLRLNKFQDEVVTQLGRAWPELPGPEDRLSARSPLLLFLKTCGEVSARFEEKFTAGPYWWPGLESNQRHPGFQPSALPPELPGPSGCRG
jgi:hypothetical protein